MKDKDNNHRLTIIDHRLPIRLLQILRTIMTIGLRSHMQDREELLNLDGMVWHNNSGQAHQLPLNLTP